MIHLKSRADKTNSNPFERRREMNFVNFRLIDPDSAHSFTERGEIFRASSPMSGIYIYKNSNWDYRASVSKGKGCGP